MGGKNIKSRAKRVRRYVAVWIDIKSTGANGFSLTHLQRYCYNNL